MSTDEKMTLNERYKYLRLVQKRYRKLDRAGRQALLDEMEAVTGKHRKSLIRLMNSDLKRRQRTNQRGRKYGPEVDDLLRVIVPSLDYVCAERLRPNLVWIAKHLARHGELVVNARLLELLGEISTATLARSLRRIGQDQPRLPRKGPAEANRWRREVPMRRIRWDEQEPGHLEVDTVHHCGSVAAGEFVHTIQMIDVATGWSERVAVLGRSYLVMSDGFVRILGRLPFAVLEVHPDNGSEFFNAHMVHFWGNWVTGVELSRSRPYHKNDNRFVEQKNDTLVRAYLGNERLDTVAQTLALNALYELMWVFYNLFQPVMRLVEKIPVYENGQLVRFKRRFDEARTPFDRLCETTVISEETRLELSRLRDRTNPRQLIQTIYDGIDALFALPGARPGISEDVYATLSTRTIEPSVENDLLELERMSRS